MMVLIVQSKLQCEFDYRKSNLKGTVILEANSSHGAKEETSKKKRALMKRNEDQPVEIPNAGCVLKTLKDTGAAKLIEECGLEGLTYGGAMVSPKMLILLLMLIMQRQMT
jgi:UDP-N-acetylmuramate dehydrogenase